MGICKNCGWTFSGSYCPRCGTEFVDESAAETSDVTLSSSATELKAELKRNLWSQMHCNCIDTNKCVELARKLIEYDSKDYYANFTLIAMTGDESAVSNFLNHSWFDDITMYADAVLDYMLTRVTGGLYCAIRDYAHRSPFAVHSKYYEAIEKCVPNRMRRKTDKEIKSHYHFVRHEYGYSVKKPIGIFWHSYPIPSVYKSKAVVGISENAFYLRKSLTSIIIPSSIKMIGENAFSGCTDLTGVYISEIVSWCKIKFFSSDSNPLTYAHNLYVNGELLEDLIIPDSVRSIGDSSFSGCTSISNVFVPDSVRLIGKWAFSGCRQLKSVRISRSVESIDTGVFFNCTSLSSISIHPGCVTSIGAFAFGRCTSLTSIVIPDSVESIGSHAFYGCSSLTSIVIPDSVKSIGSHAFDGCSSIKSIVIPRSVKSLDSSVFSGCTSLTDMYYRGSFLDWIKTTGWIYNIDLRIAIHYESKKEL